ncbi:hypothetical protein ACRJ4W_13500 [Streptomyces sp. GLT-R25]
MIAVGEKGGTPWAAVEHCLFHPQGGGQPADRGWLEGTEIIPVRDRESGLVVATVPGGGSLPLLTEGQKVRARIDLRARTAHAALHTAGHLVEAVGRMQGWEMVASNHFPGQARIEFQAPRTDTRLADPEGREEVTAVLRAAVAAAGRRRSAGLRTVPRRRAARGAPGRAALRALRGHARAQPRRPGRIGAADAQGQEGPHPRVLLRDACALYRDAGVLRRDTLAVRRTPRAAPRVPGTETRRSH